MTLLRDDYNSLRIKKIALVFELCIFFFARAKGNFKAAEP